MGRKNVIQFEPPLPAAVGFGFCRGVSRKARGSGDAGWGDSGGGAV